MWFFFGKIGLWYFFFLKISFCGIFWKNKICGIILEKVSNCNFGTKIYFGGNFENWQYKSFLTSVITFILIVIVSFWYIMERPKFWNSLEARVHARAIPFYLFVWSFLEEVNTDDTDEKSMSWSHFVFVSVVVIYLNA